MKGECLEKIIVSRRSVRDYSGQAFHLGHLAFHRAVRASVREEWAIGVLSGRRRP